VRFQSTLLSWLTKARAGNSQPEEQDGLVFLRPEMIQAGRFPFPIQKAYGSTQAGAFPPEDIQGSFTATRLDPQGTALGLAPWVDIPPGVWDLDIEYSQLLAGAVSDLTAVSSLSLNFVDNAVTRNHLIAQLHGGQQQFQRHHRRFTVTVSKDIRVFLSLSHVVGLGTALNIARSSLIATRIL
jgi:hypothetical protein